MSLFAAYAPEDAKHILADESLSTEVKNDISGLTETQLLASDDEQSRGSSETRVREVCVRERSPLRNSDDFYLDTKLDPGNLWVSTLYYPGRPEYTPQVTKYERTKRRRARRYFESQAVDADDAAEVAQRVAAYRRALADQPQDVHLWMQFIDFQERCSGGAAACRAAAEACTAAPRDAALRERRLELARRHLPPDQHLAQLRDLVANACDATQALSLWARLLSALARSPAGGLPALTAAARAALARCRAPAAYPRLLYVYGSFLRSGGLWEQLLLLLELALGMSLPPTRGFPPPPDPHAEAHEEALLAAEEIAVNSGMPLSQVWVRVERLRAGTHWRADAACAARSADPQRAPRAADLADLLLPVADGEALFLLIVAALRLVKVPLLPAAQWVQQAADGPCAAALAAAGWACDCGSALLPLLRAARRLPPAHAARRARPRALAPLLQPPHYLQHAGLMSWVEALWEAALSWTTGRQRLALLGWRLRWLHALMLLPDRQEESGESEVRRLRGLARGSLKRHAGGAALPFVQFARLEARAAGPAAARRLLLAALRRDQSAPATERLYAARVLRSLSAEEARWALCCAALGRALPADDAAHRAPPAGLCAMAKRQCEERCAEIESSFSLCSDDEESACAALLPSEAEWASARVMLAAPGERAALLRALLASERAAERAGERAGGRAGGRAGARERRWREQTACALTEAAAGDAKAVDTARSLAPLFPDNAFLNLAAAGGTVWACAGAPRSDVAALCRALAPLLADAGDDGAADAAAAERAGRRLARAAAAGGGGPLLQAARLEAAARGPRPDPQRVLYQALDMFPHSKALHVAGAAWCGGEARALADALLDKQLRLHALPDELQPLTPPPPTLTTTRPDRTI